MTTERICPRVWPVTDDERDQLAWGLLMLIETLPDSSPMIETYRNILAELTGTERSDGLQVGLTEHPDPKVVELDHFRSIGIQPTGVRLPERDEEARATAAGFPPPHKACPADGLPHYYVAVDRHGDELICEKCGHFEEEEI